MEKGFTLVELVIAMGLSVFLLTGAVLAHRYQTRSGANLAMTLALQQNLRAALYHLEWDLRMAGADLHGTAYSASDPILVAESDRIAFSWDQDGSGSIEPAKELVEYFLNYSNYLESQNLQRRENGVSQPVAQHIDALDFAYFGSNPTVPMLLPLSVDDRRNIRRVQITLVGRTPTPLKLGRAAGRTVYRNPQGEQVLATENDHHRHVLLGGDVTLRNLPKRR